MTQVITSRSPRLVERLREQGVAPLQRVLTPEFFASVRNEPTRAYTVLVPEVVFWLLACVALGDGAMAGAISTLWMSLRAARPTWALEPVTAAAFTTARKRLPVRYLLDLLEAFLKRFDSQFGERFLWRGFRLVGIDGSGLNLPKGSPSLMEAFPPPSNAKGPSKRPQALLVGLVDLWTGVCRGFELVSLKVGELAGAKKVVLNLRSGDLLLADRNFPHYEMMIRIRATRAHFLMRMSERHFLDPKYERTYLGPDEWLITITKSKKLAKLYPEMPESLTVRILRYQLPGFRVSYLITSLLYSEIFTYQELVELYHERWRHETRHDEWKNTLQIANLRSKSPEGILKEVTAQLILNNAIRWVMAEAAPSPLRAIDLQFRACKRLVVASAARMASATPTEIPAHYESLKVLMAERRIRVRPGRSYPRKTSNTVGRNKGNGQFAKPAKLSSPSGTAVAPASP